MWTSITEVTKIVQVSKKLCIHWDSGSKGKESTLASDVNFWMEHLQTIHQNRQEGARKVAETRQKKKAVVANKNQATECHCGICNYLYEEETDEEEIWIACDQCQLWFHVGCVNLVPEDIPDEFICPKCLI